MAKRRLSAWVNYDVDACGSVPNSVLSTALPRHSARARLDQLVIRETRVLAAMARWLGWIFAPAQSNRRRDRERGRWHSGRPLSRRQG